LECIRKNLSDLRITVLPPRSISPVDRAPGPGNGLGEFHAGSRGIPDENVVADYTGGGHGRLSGIHRKQSPSDHAGCASIPRTEQFIKPREPGQRGVRPLALRQG